jgi:hypothetical protein
MNKMASLIKLIKELEESHVNVNADGYLDSNHQLVKKISYLADELLITSNGKLHIDNMEILDTAGYRTFPVEGDSFGWLIGGVQTSIGIITYG